MADKNRESTENWKQSKQFTPPRRKKCILCIDRIDAVDYKQVDFLRNFLTDRGKIRPRHKTGTCGKHQRRLTEAVKRARHLALLPYTGEHVRRSR